MPRISSYEIETAKEGSSGGEKKYRAGTLSKENGKATLMTSTDDKPNLYKYSDAKAAAKDYDLFKSEAEMGMKKGGAVKNSASKRADGCAIKGKTRGRMV